MSRYLLFIWIGSAFLFFAACSRGGNPGLDVYLRTNAAAVDSPASVDTRPVKFRIEPGATARQVSRQLEEAGLIRDALLFEAFVRVNNLDNQIQAGAFVLNPSMTLREIVTTLERGRPASITVTTPEGWRLEQTADTLTQAAVLASPAEAEAYRQQALAGDLTGLDPARYPFLQGRPAGASLEGYLFPDTYDLPEPDATAADLLARQLDNFADQVLPRYDEARQTGTTALDLHSVLTLASIVEREAVVPEERPAIAGVYLNRLAAGMPLQADPTVQYALGFQPTTGQWWKTPIFLEEYSSVVSPYNTYLNPGLPPGPIASPGLSSIAAVLAPEAHDYLFFVALPDGSGRHVFAKTFEEHQENVRRYQQGN